LSGLFRYTHDAWEYALIAGKGGYELRRRPADDHRTHAGWVSENGQDAERVGVINRQELHRSITQAVIAAVRAGLPVALDAGRYKSFADLPALDPKRARIRALRHQAAQALEKFHRAKRNASLANNPDIAAGFVEDAERAHSERERLERELSHLEATVADPELGDHFESTATMVAAALACLHNAADTGPRELTEALRTIISGERFTVCDEGIAWSLFIELPHEEGTVRLGPITGRVASGPSQQRKTAGGLTRRQRASQVRALTDAGLDEPAALAAVRCPHPSLAAVLQSHLDGGDLPADVDEAWAHHVIGVYTGPRFRWERGKWAQTYPMRQVVLDAVMAAGGTATTKQLAGRGVKLEQVRYLTRHLDTPTGHPILTAQGQGQSRRYSVLRCPHCGGHASLSCVTPETRPGVLCPACRRTPTPDSPVFPEWYATPTRTLPTVDQP
jgi:hypothetical protein